jgi:hypothetical protein
MFFSMVGEIVAFDHKFSLGLISIHLGKCFDGRIYALALFVFAYSKESEWACSAPGSASMSMEPGAIHTLGHDAYAISVDAMCQQHIATPGRRHPDLIGTLYGRLDCDRYSSAFKHHPLYVTTTKVFMYIGRYKTDVDVIRLAGVYGPIYGRMIKEIHFVYHGSNAVHVA